MRSQFDEGSRGVPELSRTRARLDRVDVSATLKFVSHPGVVRVSGGATGRFVWYSLLRMKPVAPALLADDTESDETSLQSEIRALCDAKASQERITIPSPPSEEALRATTPFPPRSGVASVETIPAPPASSASSARKRVEAGDDPESSLESEPLRPTIPGPPRTPRIAGF
jgi:hypothetical protein